MSGSSLCRLSSAVTPHERCLVTGYYYTSGVQLKATYISNTTVPAYFMNIVTLPRSCRCFSTCRTINFAALPWLLCIVMVPKRCYILSRYSKTQFSMLPTMEDLDIHHHIANIFRCSFTCKTLCWLHVRTCSALYKLVYL